MTIEKSAESESVKLLTGIPRSGTTLCCKLLNLRTDSIALHEPIEPKNIDGSITSEQALIKMAAEFVKFKQAIVTGNPFPHGDKGGLQIDNPVGTQSKDGVRQVVAQRGLVQLPPRSADSFTLVIKQNAMFTALLPQLSSRFDTVCIVRNPIEVLLSWKTVDLPVNRGRIPAGERFDETLKTSLDAQSSVTLRQIKIYQWFIEKFVASGLPVIRYEDVIASGGTVLDNALGLPDIERTAMSKQHRTFSTGIIASVESCLPGLMQMDCGDLYSKQDIQNAFDSIEQQ